MEGGGTGAGGSAGPRDRAGLRYQITVALVAAGVFVGCMISPPSLMDDVGAGPGGNRPRPTRPRGSSLPDSGRAGGGGSIRGLHDQPAIPDGRCRRGTGADCAEYAAIGRLGDGAAGRGGVPRKITLEVLDDGGRVRHIRGTRLGGADSDRIERGIAVLGDGAVWGVGIRAASGAARGAGIDRTSAV